MSANEYDYTEYDYTELDLKFKEMTKSNPTELLSGVGVVPIRPLLPWLISEAKKLPNTSHFKKVLFVAEQLIGSLFWMFVGRLYVWCNREKGFIDLLLVPRSCMPMEGGRYIPGVRTGWAWLIGFMGKYQWYSSYIHETLHFVIDKLEGYVVSDSFDKISRPMKKDPELHDYLYWDLYFGIDRSAGWLPELTPYVKDTPELQRMRRLKLAYHGIDIGSRGRAITTSEQ